MIRDEWIKREFGIDDSASDSIKKYVTTLKTLYEDMEISRGWKTAYIECFSIEAYTVELVDEDPMNSEYSPTVSLWCNENCTGRWSAHNPIWWEFEIESDAMAFKMRWGD